MPTNAVLVEKMILFFLEDILIINLLKVFTNPKIYDIINMRNKPNMTFRGIFLYGGTLLFLRPQRFEFGKKYKFRLCGYGFCSYLSKVCFAAIGACAFSGA